MKLTKSNLTKFSPMICLFLIVAIACQSPPETDENVLADTTDTSSTPIEPDWRVETDVSPDIGTPETGFDYWVRIIDEEIACEVGPSFQIKFDFNNDNLFDTEWLDTLPPLPQFGTFGKQVIAFVIKDSSNLTSQDSICYYVQDLIQITPINTTGHSQLNFDWSRDGSDRIAFDMYGGELAANQSLWVMNYPNGDPWKVSFNPTPGEYFYDQYPEWSPDGSQLACYSGNGLDLINLETGDRTNISSAREYDVLAWAPDGESLLYWGYYDLAGRTMSYNLSTEESEVFFDDRKYVCWSPDGSKLAVHDRYSWTDTVGVVQIIDYETLQIEAEYAIPTPKGTMDWSPDGKWISFGLVDTGVFYILNFESENLYIFHPGEFDLHWWGVWSGDAQIFSFVARERGGGVWPSIWGIEFPADLD